MLAGSMLSADSMGTSIAAIVAARRPGAPFSKINGSTLMLISPYADPPLRSLCRLHCVPLRHTLPSPLHCVPLRHTLPAPHLSWDRMGETQVRVVFHVAHRQSKGVGAAAPPGDCEDQAGVYQKVCRGED